MADKDPKFYNELKQLNQDLQKFINDTLQQSYYFDLTPTLEDYIRQFQELEKQHVATPTTIDVADDDDEDAPPPEPKIDKFEETDAKFSVRCKFYEKAKVVNGETALNLLGFGMLYVKDLDASNKLQVIVRQEPDLRRVLLNELITPNIPIKLMNKAVQMVFPVLGAPNKLCVAKVKDDKEASNLYEVLNSVHK